LLLRDAVGDGPTPQWRPRSNSSRCFRSRESDPANISRNGAGSHTSAVRALAARSGQRPMPDPSCRPAARAAAHGRSSAGCIWSTVDERRPLSIIECRRCARLAPFLRMRFAIFDRLPRGGDRPTPTQPLHLNETRRFINFNVQEKGRDTFQVFKFSSFKFSSCSSFYRSQHELVFVSGRPILSASIGARDCAKLLESVPQRLMH
jgi:hypothetical protein